MAASLSGALLWLQSTEAAEALAAHDVDDDDSFGNGGERSTEELQGIVATLLHAHASRREQKRIESYRVDRSK